MSQRNRHVACWLFGLLVGLVFQAVPADAGADRFYQQGIRAYADEHFAEAVLAFEKALQVAPDTAEYHRWLGKAYGRRAQQVFILRSALLARKTRQHFERAVELEPDNIDALMNLLEYYSKAPALLGGGRKKAQALAERIRLLDERSGLQAQALLNE